MEGQVQALTVGRDRRFTGRAAELSLLLEALDSGGPTVTHVYGVGGIGKSRILDEFAAIARSKGGAVLRFDCRAIEPTPSGFLQALEGAAGATNGESADGNHVFRRLRGVAEPVVIALDTYEVFASLDAWLRTDALPRFQGSVRMVLVGRDPPVRQWLTAARPGEFRSIALGPLSVPDALGLLAGLGVAGELARRINRVAQGHPLALTMAALLHGGRFDRDVEDVATASVDEVAREYLAQIPDRGTREVIEAASVIRRVTEPLLEAMLPHVMPADAIDRLRQLPFVEATRDGLVLHDAVRDSVATALRTSAPERSRGYRTAAWRQLRNELRVSSPTADMWRLTADLLYLLDQPDVRQVFFPTGLRAVAIEPAHLEDERDFYGIIDRHHGPEARRALAAWWEFHPRSVKMVRGRGGEAQGLTIFAPAHQLHPRIAERDPVAACWMEHYRPRSDRGDAIFVRAWVDRDAGEGASATYGAFNLDLKRTYVEMRPKLRYVYVVARQFDLGVLDELKWHHPGDGLRALTLDREQFLLTWLDMGPASVEGWLANVIGSELEVEDEPLLSAVDVDAHELRLGDRRIQLTPLEAGFIACLLAKPGRVVSRATLVERVWGYESSATSNVIESLVRGLRRKLGPDAGFIETVRAAGYRAGFPARDS